MLPLQDRCSISVEGLVRNVAAAMFEGSNTIWLVLPNPCDSVQRICKSVVFPLLLLPLALTGKATSCLAIFRDRNLAVLLPIRLGFNPSPYFRIQ